MRSLSSPVPAPFPGHWDGRRCGGHAVLGHRLPQHPAGGPAPVKRKGGGECSCCPPAQLRKQNDSRMAGFGVLFSLCSVSVFYMKRSYFASAQVFHWSQINSHKKVHSEVSRPPQLSPPPCPQLNHFTSILCVLPRVSLT